MFVPFNSILEAVAHAALTEDERRKILGAVGEKLNNQFRISWLS